MALYHAKLIDEGFTFRRNPSETGQRKVILGSSVLGYLYIQTKEQFSFCYTFILEALVIIINVYLIAN